MISKICTGHSFYGSIRYICQEKKHSQILQVEGVRGYEQKLMIQDFERQHRLRPEKKQACFHGILSFYPGEKPSDNTVIEIAGKYLAGLNIKNTQYAIVKHTDKAHLHVHLIANMVDNNGKSISDRWIALRGKKLAQQLTLDYKLTRSLSKELSRTQYHNLREPDQHKYKIYAAIKHYLRDSRSLDELKERLGRLGIEMKFKMKGKTDVRQGVSFRLGEYCFKGSEIDRQFSYANLEKAISQLQKKTLTQPTEQKQSDQIRKPDRFHPEKVKSIGKGVTKEMTKVLEQLLKQEQDFERTPYELTQEAERKRRRHRQQHL